MQAQGCTSVSSIASLRARLRVRCAPVMAVVAAAVLSACAPMAPSTEGALVTTGEGVANSQAGQRAASQLLASMAPAPLRAEHLGDPSLALQDELDAMDLPEVDQAGVASWYGPRFHGRKTANGERYNQYELTAAHRKYAFNTNLCVRNTGNGKTVVVRVNDRGPYVGNRVIDLSKAAAEEIGMLDSGVKKVEIYKLDEGQDECPDVLLQAQG